MPRIVCYFYFGLEIFFFAYLDGADKLNSFVKDSGLSISFFFFLAVGFIAFNIYSKLLGEKILFPFQHWVQLKSDINYSRFGDNQTSPVNLMAHYGVKQGRERIAYTRVRSFLYKEDDINIKFEHSGIHVMYITSISLFFNAFIMLFYGEKFSRFIFIIISSIIVYYVSILCDTIQHKIEADEFKSHKDSILVFLSEQKLLVIS